MTARKKLTAEESRDNRIQPCALRLEKQRHALSLELALDGAMIRRFVTEDLAELRKAGPERSIVSHEDGFFLRRGSGAGSLTIENLSYQSRTHFEDSYVDDSDIPKGMLRHADQYLVRWLNEHRDEIMLGIADMMMADAAADAKSVMAAFENEYARTRSIIQDALSKSAKPCAR